MAAHFLLSGIIGLPGTTQESGGNIRFLLPAPNLTTLIMDLGNEQLASFGVSLARVFNDSTPCGRLGI